MNCANRPTKNIYVVCVNLTAIIITLFSGWCQTNLHHIECILGFFVIYRRCRRVRRRRRMKRRRKRRKWSQTSSSWRIQPEWCLLSSKSSPCQRAVGTSPSNRYVTEFPPSEIISYCSILLQPASLSCSQNKWLALRSSLSFAFGLCQVF